MEEPAVYSGLFTPTADLTFPEPRCMALHVTWGEAMIIFHADGRLELMGLPTPDAAAVAFWRAVQRWAPAGMDVTLPVGYGAQE